MTKRELVLRFMRDFFRAKTPIELAEHELLEARLAQMDAETSVEYYVAMVQYNQKRINRLTEHLEKMYAGQESFSQLGVRMVRDQHDDSIIPGPIERIPTSGQGQTEVKGRGV